MCPSVFRGSLRIAGFNFSFVIKMCWWPEKALASSISHTGLLYLSKISHNCTVHTTSCSALQTLIKVLSPLPYLLSFTVSQQLFMCHSGDIWSQLLISRQSAFGFLPAPFGWGTFCFSVCCCAGAHAGLCLCILLFSCTAMCSYVERWENNCRRGPDCMKSQ